MRPQQGGITTRQVLVALLVLIGGLVVISGLGAGFSIATFVNTDSLEHGMSSLHKAVKELSGCCQQDDMAEGADYDPMPALRCKPRPANRNYAFRGERLDTIAGQVITTVGEQVMPSGATCVVAGAQSGRIYRRCPGDSSISLWADLSSLLGIVGGEGGLLGLAIDGSGGHLYADFTVRTGTPAAQARGNLCNRTQFEPAYPDQWKSFPVVATGTIARFSVDNTDVVNIASLFPLLKTNRRNIQHQGYDTLRLLKRHGRDYLTAAIGDDVDRNLNGSPRNVGPTTMLGKVFLMDIAATVAAGPMASGVDDYTNLSVQRRQALQMIMYGARNPGGLSINTRILADRVSMSFVIQGNEGGDGAYLVNYPPDEAPLPLDAGWPDIMGGMLTTERLFQVSQQCPGYVSNATTYYPGSSRSYVTIRSDKLVSKHDIVYRPYLYNGEDIAVNANFADPLVGFSGPLLSSAFTYGGGSSNECPVVVNTAQTLAGDYLGIGFTRVDLSLLAATGISAEIPKFIVSTPNYRNTQMWTRQNLINIHDVVLPYIGNGTVMSPTASQSNIAMSGFYFATFRVDGGYSEIYSAELVAA